MPRRGKRPPAQYGGYEIDGEETRVRIGPKDTVLWERAHKGQPFANPDGTVPSERQAWLLWSSSKRAGQHDFDYATWFNKIDDMWLEVEDDEDQKEDEEGYEDPTDGAGLDS